VVQSYASFLVGPGVSAEVCVERVEIVLRRDVYRLINQNAAIVCDMTHPTR